MKKRLDKWLYTKGMKKVSLQAPQESEDGLRTVSAMYSRDTGEHSGQPIYTAQHLAKNRLSMYSERQYKWLAC